MILGNRKISMEIRHYYFFTTPQVFKIYFGNKKLPKNMPVTGSFEVKIKEHRLSQRGG